jgi:beta-glucosidase
VRQRFPDATVRFVEGTGLVGAPLKSVPSDAFCQDSQCRTPGLTLEEYAGTALKGAPSRSASAADVSFSWGRPARQMRASSIRWSGFITPQDSGPYRFKLNGDGGYRIVINGREVVNAWDAAEPAMIADGEVTLEAGHRYAITVEAIQSGDRGGQTLLWSNFAEREDAALAAAKDADLVLFAAGLTAKLEGEEMRVAAKGFAGGDRTSIDLPEPQQKLLERLHATGKPVVLVLLNGSALAVNWADAHVPAIIEAWYPGGSGGRAIAELIAGDFSPSGRLPLTFYKSVDQLPPFGDYDMAGRTYRYFTGDPLYPFGHGLSYTQFRYACETNIAAAAGKPARVSMTITNAGVRDGHEVAQLYVSRPEAGAPARTLAGFQRVFLKQGETRRLTFDLSPDAFSVVQPDGRRVVRAGPAAIWIGGGQQGHASGCPMTAVVTGEATLAAR